MVAKCRCSPRIRQPPRVPRRPSSKDLPGGFRYLGENNTVVAAWAKPLGNGVYRVIFVEDIVYGWQAIVGDLDLARIERLSYLDEAFDWPETKPKGPVPTTIEKIRAIALRETGAVEQIDGSHFGTIDDAVAWALTVA